MKTNAQVAAAFIRGESANSLNMHSTGTVLYSYATPIARYANDGSIIVSSQHHSVTTTRHHSELWKAAYAAGYSGPAHWEGNPDRQKRPAWDQVDIVPFHDANFPASLYGKPARTDYGYDMVNAHNMSDHDARAVVWTFSDAAYEERAANRAWYESRNHASVTRKETATV